MDVVVYILVVLAVLQPGYSKKNIEEEEYGVKYATNCEGKLCHMYISSIPFCILFTA